MLKKINFMFTMLLAILVIACDDDTIENRVQGGSDVISIAIDQMPIDYAPVNLDIEAKPSFSGIISSTSDLAKVTISVTGSAGETVLSEVTSFSGRSYSFDETPVYDLSMNTLIAKAEDVNGEIVEEFRKISVKGGPVIGLDQAEFVVDLSVSTKDMLTGSVKSDGGILNKIVIYLTKDGTESEYKSMTMSGEQKSTYDIEEELGFEIGMSSVRVYSIDDLQNENSKTLSINVVESPVFEMFEVNGIVLNGTENRGDAGIDIAVSLKDGKAYEMADLTSEGAAPTGFGIDFMLASADRTVNKLRFFSPSTQAGDKFKLGEENPDLTDLNETLFSWLGRGDAAAFDAATVESIQAMNLDDEAAKVDPKLSHIDDKPDTGIDVVGDGNAGGSIQCVYFETEWGAQCLVLMRKLDLGEDHKADAYKLDFKVVYQTN